MSAHVPSLALLTIFVLAAFVGFEVISKVSSVLHTPLMSGANAIHGIILVGAMVVLGTADSTGQKVAGFLAVVLATLNAVGGFVVTDRMLHMFSGKRRSIPSPADSQRLPGQPAPPTPTAQPVPPAEPRSEVPAPSVASSAALEPPVGPPPAAPTHSVQEVAR